IFTASSETEPELMNIRLDRGPEMTPMGIECSLKPFGTDGAGTEVTVRRVLPGSLAEQAGLKVGVRITLMNGKDVRFMEQGVVYMDKHGNDDARLFGSHSSIMLCSRYRGCQSNSEKCARDHICG